MTLNAKWVLGLTDSPEGSKPAPAVRPIGARMPKNTRVIGVAVDNGELYVDDVDALPAVLDELVRVDPTWSWLMAETVVRYGDASPVVDTPRWMTTYALSHHVSDALWGLVASVDADIDQVSPAELVANMASFTTTQVIAWTVRRYDELSDLELARALYGMPIWARCVVMKVVQPHEVTSDRLSRALRAYIEHTQSSVELAG